MNRPMRIYVDTSVVGGCFDEEFAEHSNKLMSGARDGQFRLLLSNLLFIELEDAPEPVRLMIDNLPASTVEMIDIGDEVIALRDAYLKAQIVGERWRDDATHVAAATVARADCIVSWNLHHIVKLNKIKAYNQVNLLNGYGMLTILTPREVVGDDENEEKL